MSLVVEDRNGCALHGALRLLGAIEGVVPIVHASAGCALAAGFGDLAGGGHLTSLDPGATGLLERHVVYGGAARLREQIRNTVKVVTGQAYVVLTGCVPELVGDDTQAMAREAREQQYPALAVATPGFKGNACHGYALVLAELAEHLPALLGPAGASEAGAVNLLGVVPGFDAFWEGDLLELEHWIAQLGHPVLRLLGFAQSAQDWRALPSARLNVVLSPWGLEAAQRLQRLHGTPYIDFGWVPSGPDLGELLAQIGAALEVEPERVAAVQQRLEERLRYFLHKLLPAYLQHDLQKRVAVVGSAATAIGVARCLGGLLGLSLGVVVVTDQPLEQARQRIVDALRNGNGAADAGSGQDVDVVFTDSGDEIAASLQRARPEAIFASGNEALVAAALGVPLVEIAAPLRAGPVALRALAGVAGAIHLLELYAAAAIRMQAHPALRPAGARGVSLPAAVNSLALARGRVRGA